MTLSLPAFAKVNLDLRILGVRSDGYHDLRTIFQSLALADALLAAGANPTDGVSVHITGGGGNIAALDLLHRYGVDVNGIHGGTPPLVHMMLWSTNPAGPRWLLAHGADPNLSWGVDDEAPLHVAARRWDVPMRRPHLRSSPARRRPIQLSPRSAAARSR